MGKWKKAAEAAELTAPNRGAQVWKFRRLYRPPPGTHKGEAVVGRNGHTGYPVTFIGPGVVEGGMGTSIFVRDHPERDVLDDEPTMFDYQRLEELLEADEAYMAALRAAVDAELAPEAMATLETEFRRVVDTLLLETIDFLEALVTPLSRAHTLWLRDALAKNAEPK